MSPMPTRARSVGMVRPRLCVVWMTPMASWSPRARIAVGGGVSFERVGDLIVLDAGAAIDVVQHARGGSPAGMDDFVLVLRLVREDGTLKVAWDRAYDYQSWRSLGL